LLCCQATEEQRLFRYQSLYKNLLIKVSLRFVGQFSVEQQSFNGVCCKFNAKMESAIMSRHLNLLLAIFQEPTSANIHWREVESLLHHLGGTIEPSHGARFRVVLNEVETILHHPHHGSECSKQTIKQLRESLAQAGVSPSPR
jgi:hypothetical protein